ncbi:DUF6220 domain-containing protein [Petropleomorpha daqingensis]|uniref:Uncharacterized protein n=1 Tax=Petropleomorpha daqingensis TaxID=2026353 RepID=A0A853CC96_9ACTN|nr:DUF6220 domain-containing protein [Petropleomorpha daqingensis]NYJ05374.1 hypothetical protein [Petropleomorpha daqingensis]
MTDSPAPTASRQRSPLLPVYRVVLALFLLAGAVQIFLAGFGVWGHDFQAHRVLGFTMAGIALVVFVLALVSRAGRRDVVLALVLVLLTGGAQSLLADAGGSGAFWGGLHALDGLVILGIAGFLHGAAIRRGRAAA